ncbi:MAG: NUDIX domain-containing protein [Candidatus Bathyarchaeota archaeon]|nr:NUDIX domain-containing protein [Candidatus Bathyarchaeota archaeon]
MEYNDRCVAYITRGDQLLVFKHVKYPEIGLLVPAGHPEDGESLESAVLREALEETGLMGLKLVKYLGFKLMDFTDQGYGIEKRHFFHLSFEGETPDTWIHTEKYPSMGPDPELDYKFFWESLDTVELFWDHGAMLDKI